MTFVKNIKLAFLISVFIVAFFNTRGYSQENISGHEKLSAHDIQVMQLAEKIREAKDNNNILNLRTLEEEMNKLTGSVSIPFVNDPNVTGILRTEEFYTGETDGITTISLDTFWSVATQTSSRSSHIYAAVTQVRQPSSIMKIYVSYDHGVTWNLKCTYSGFMDGVQFSGDELDIEPIISGPDTLVYAVAGFVYGGSYYSLIARCNITNGTTIVQAYSLMNNKNYNPRIVSDNTYHTSATYLYITVASDTMIAANNQTIRPRLCVIMNPFEGAFVQTHRNPGTRGSFWWSHIGMPTGSLTYQDVGYFRNPNGKFDVVYVSAIFQGTNYIYNAWSNSYGSSNTGNFSVNQIQPVAKVRLAFNGGSNLNGAMIYIKYSTANLNGLSNAVVYNTTSGGLNAASWTQSEITSGSDSVNSCDIQAVKLANNKFKFAYSTYAGKSYYTSNITEYSYSPSVIINSIGSSTGHAKVRAGYRLTTDSCLSLWVRSTNIGFYCTYGCAGYVGIIQNETFVPNKFSLSQNYPNPFNPVTNIKFSLPKLSYVNLAVYDVTGKVVAELVNRQMDAGSYTANFDASLLSSGVYFYKLTAGDFTDVKKMMLLK